MRRLFHFTHVSNIPGIFKAGGLYCDAYQLPAAARNVGHSEIKEQRKRRKVPIPPGGVVADYVPFYYAPRSPMLYVITKNNVPGVSVDAHEIVYFVATADNASSTCNCCISDKNASMFAAGFYPCQQMENVIDWQLMDAQRWENTASDTDRKSRRMAEFLVHNFAPLSIFEGIAVYEKGILDYVRQQIDAFGLHLKTGIKPSWYF